MIEFACIFRASLAATRPKTAAEPLLLLYFREQLRSVTVWVMFLHPRSVPGEEPEPAPPANDVGDGDSGENSSDGSSLERNEVSLQSTHTCIGNCDAINSLSLTYFSCAILNQWHQFSLFLSFLDCLSSQQGWYKVLTCWRHQSQTPAPPLLTETFNMGGNGEPLAHGRIWSGPLKLFLPALILCKRVLQLEPYVWTINALQCRPLEEYYGWHHSHHGSCFQ